MVLPKSMRIKGYKCFDYIHKTAAKYNSHLILLKVTEANPKLLKIIDREKEISSCRCAISISNKVSKKAVLRNQLRRSLHDYLRTRLEGIREYQQKWILLSLKPDSINKNLSDLQNECDKLLIRAGLGNG